MTINIGLLLFPDVQQLDLTAPYEVFASLPGTTMHLIWKDLAPVASVTGLVLTPTVTLDEAPQMDVLCIPGGAGVNALMEDEAVLDFVRRQAEGARYVTSVCTGALVLGAAGLLRGKRATTHWASHDLLRRFGATPVKDRVVWDGRLVTGGGVTAGLDFALILVDQLAGRGAAEAIQLTLEYAPDPPFNAGTPATAAAATARAIRQSSAPIREEREAITDRLSGAE
jgi:cyclohexyl-isocyanide hydratase